MAKRLHGLMVFGSPCVTAGGTLHRLPATRQPVREWAAGLPDLCPECGAEVCDCLTPAELAALLARLDADPHGVNDQEDLSNLELPY